MTITNPIERFGAGFRSFWCEHSAHGVELVTHVCCNGAKRYKPPCPLCGHVGNYGFPHRLLSEKERDSACVLPARKDEAAISRSGNLL
jgi:hypothetical protein